MMPAIAWMFVNIAGVLGVLWVGFRICISSTALARADAWRRLVVAALIAYYVLPQGVTPLVLVFVATEIAGASAQFLALQRLRF